MKKKEKKRKREKEKKKEEKEIRKLNFVYRELALELALVVGILKFL